ncbi:hypothetical protein HK096_009757, partial [Nowakowskiella sp. JEL0078]
MKGTMISLKLIFAVCLFSQLAQATLDVFSILPECAALNIIKSTNSSFLNAYEFSIVNLRFSTSSPPEAIIYPKNAHDVSLAVVCSNLAKYTIRVRSGGHSYEAVAGAGATLGQLYYQIALKTSTLGFPAGVCPTVGLGGHISGGGLGPLGRKYGMAADHVQEIQIVTASGLILTCSSTRNADLFWALRGGGGGNFGIVVQFTLNLVDVPPAVTVGVLAAPFAYAIPLFKGYQSWISQNFNKDLTTKVFMDGSIIMMEVAFLGNRSQALTELSTSPFGSLITDQNLIETNWSGAVYAYAANFNLSVPVSMLMERFDSDKNSFHASSDFISKPLTDEGINTMIQSLASASYGGYSYIILDGHVNGQ